MTKRYDPNQNTAAERVNYRRGIIKQEFLNGIITTDIRLIKKIVVEFIDIYNQERPHLSCHMLTPQEMHQQQKLKMKTYKKKKVPRKSRYFMFNFILKKTVSFI